MGVGCRGYISLVKRIGLGRKILVVVVTGIEFLVGAFDLCGDGQVCGNICSFRRLRIVQHLVPRQEFGVQ